MGDVAGAQDGATPSPGSGEAPHPEGLKMDREVALSFIIPTIGRASLKPLIEEILLQIGPDDEILVVGDGPQPNARIQAECLDARIKYHEHGPDHCWGHPQRNWAMKICRGDYIFSLDDDDRLEEGAIQSIKRATVENPRRPLIFRAHFRHMIRWESQEIKLTNVSTQMVVVPNLPERLGSWGRRYEGDFDFIVSTAKLYPGGEESVVWRPEIVASHGWGGKAPPRTPKKA